MARDRAALVLVPLLLAACPKGPSPVDGGALDMAVADMASADMTVVADMTPLPQGGALVPGPCPSTLNNARCFFPPGTKVGFY